MVDGLLLRKCCTFIHPHAWGVLGFYMKINDEPVSWLRQNASKPDVGLQYAVRLFGLECAVRLFRAVFSWHDASER